MLEMAQECVDAMGKEVAGLQEKLTKALQEAREKLQQEQPTVSGLGASHK